MLISGKTGKVGPSNMADLPANQIFLDAIRVAIEDKNTQSRSKVPSKYYSPSALNCIRQMYYKRIGTIPDKDDMSYGNVGMADTGTRRHEAIQEALEYMTHKGTSPFLYVDVAKFIEQKQLRGKCKNLVITGKYGAETALLDKDRGVSFRCDGILLFRPTKKFYLFEFKNQISYKASGKDAVDRAHLNQVTTYCMELDLDKALVLYENRDNCELFCPEVLNISDYDKQMVIKLLSDCDEYVNKGIVPPKPQTVSSKDCNYCNYKSYCRKDVS